MAFSIKKAPQSSWRFELKYRLTYQQYYRVRSALAPYMEPDDYSRGDPYLVRSLYFDTFNYQAYHEKIQGDFGRIKIRLRTYDSSPAKKPPVRVELKTRRGEAMEKFNTFVTTGECLEFLDTWHWPISQGDPVLLEFERLVHLRHLRPKILVQYRREGLQCRGRENLRVTFDHNVQSAGAASLFPAEEVFFRSQTPGTVIFEIKCRIEKPLWLTNIIKKHSLKYVANSKYTQGIEIARADVISPGWNPGYRDPSVPAPRHIREGYKRKLPFGNRERGL